MSTSRKLGLKAARALSAPLKALTWRIEGQGAILPRLHGANRQSARLNRSQIGRCWPKENENGYLTVRPRRQGSAGVERRSAIRCQAGAQGPADLGNQVLSGSGGPHARQGAV